MIGEHMNQSDALLLFAAAHANAALIEALLEEGANANVHDDQGRTPLILTVLQARRWGGRAKARFRRAARLLIVKSDVAVVDLHGHTALALASQVGLDYLERLISDSRFHFYEVLPISRRTRALLTHLKTMNDGYFSVAALSCPQSPKI
jgi:ankyrin repeat protein